MIREILAAVTIIAQMSQPALADARNVVLVHGATMDGSTWHDVYELLSKEGLKVSIVQLPHTSLADDVDATRLILKQQTGPTVLVGHSCAGGVITEAGNSNNVGALVYVAAFQPEQGETINDLASRYPMKFHVKMLDDKSFVPDPQHYHEDIGADLPKATTDFLSASSKPMTFEPYSVRFHNTPWKDKPTFGIITTEDHTLSPDLLRWMYSRSNTKAVEIKASHMVQMSQPKRVADVIIEAVRAVE